MDKKILVFSMLFLLSCNELEKNKSSSSEINKKQIIDVIQKDKNSDLDEVINSIELKELPLKDTTNFDNFNCIDFFDKDEIRILQIEEIYPDFYKEGFDYKAAPSYKFELYKNFYSVVLIICKGENEMESILVNYDLDGALIDFKVISYDEIAEGWSRVESKIEQNRLTTTHILWLDEKQEEVELFEIGKNGIIQSLIEN